MKKETKTIALITAAGTGTRTNQDIPKQFIHIQNKPLIIYTMEAFEKHPKVDEIVVICLKGWEEILKAYAKQFNIKKFRYIAKGGNTGQESIFNGIKEVKKHFSEDSVILVHDGNRGLVTQEIISDALSTYYEKGNGVAAIPCTEVVFRNESEDFCSKREIPRKELYRTQTPHVFDLKKMLWAHSEAARLNIKESPATCSLMAELGETIYFSKGSEVNFKITTLDDIDIFKALLNVERDEWIK